MPRLGRVAITTSVGMNRGSQGIGWSRAVALRGVGKFQRGANQRASIDDADSVSVCLSDGWPFFGFERRFAMQTGAVQSSIHAPLR